MITKISHVPIFVLDQASAKSFYVDKLGFKLHTEAEMGNGFTWLTVTPPEQPDIELSLLVPKPGLMFDEETAKAVEDLVRRGKMGAAAFHTDDCRKTYEELKAKGVKFRSEPKEEFYGIEVVMEDDSGNWFSVTQPK